MRNPDRVALRRLEVAQLTADGVSSCRAIAAELGVSASTASRDLRALAAVPEPSGPFFGTPGGGVAAPYVAPVAPVAAEGVSYALVAERVAELDRLLAEWRERAAYQTPAAALFARLLHARHALSESECAGHIAVADAQAQIQATADRLVQVLKDAQREFEIAGLGENTKPVIQRAYETAYRALGGM